MATPPVETSVPPQPVYRPDDSRPQHDLARLREGGIRRHESRRLVLYTDIPDEQASPLPRLMDEAYDAWERWFGPLPPARDGSDFQMTGYIMADQELFREHGLLPETLPPFAHGRHQGQQFWMNDQADAYYRAHLMLHEGTHCFMTIVPNPMTSATWYMEGMAEFFGTHFAPPGQPVQFGVMPGHREAFAGLGRIRMIADEIAGGGVLPLEHVLNFPPHEFGTENNRYAWSWALCHFLATHPRYRERFRNVQQQVRPLHASEDFLSLFQADWTDLREEWQLFAANLCHGYDTERAAISFIAGKALPSEGKVLKVVADRGWQSSAVRVEMGRTYRISATGRFQLALQPKPWVSEPQGVSIRYFEGRPLGQLLACIRAPGETITMTRVISIGESAVFVPDWDGTLYFRLNDVWNELSDNSGEVQVTIHLED